MIIQGVNDSRRGHQDRAAGHSKHQGWMITIIDDGFLHWSWFLLVLISMRWWWSRKTGSMWVLLSVEIFILVLNQHCWKARWWWWRRTLWTRSALVLRSLLWGTWRVVSYLSAPPRASMTRRSLWSLRRWWRWSWWQYHRKWNEVFCIWQICDDNNSEFFQLILTMTFHSAQHQRSRGLRWLGTPLKRLLTGSPGIQLHMTRWDSNTRLWPNHFQFIFLAAHAH